MNSVDWELARRKLIAQGVTDFTDGDIIRAYHESCDLKQREIDAAIKLAKDQADAAIAIAAPVAEIVAEPVVDTVAANDKGFKSWFGNIA